MISLETYGNLLRLSQIYHKFLPGLQDEVVDTPQGIPYRGKQSIIKTVGVSLVQ